MVVVVVAVAVERVVVLTEVVVGPGVNTVTVEAFSVTVEVIAVDELVDTVVVGALGETNAFG